MQYGESAKAANFRCDAISVQGFTRNKGAALSSFEARELDLLREQGGFCPADRLVRRKAIVIDDAEVPPRIALHRSWMVSLETEADLQKRTDE